MNRLPAYAICVGLLTLLLAAGCPGKKDATQTPTPTPRDSSVCDSIVSEQLTWCMQPAPSATPEGIGQ